MPNRGKMLFDTEYRINGILVFTSSKWHRSSLIEKHSTTIWHSSMMFTAGCVLDFQIQISGV